MNAENVTSWDQPSSGAAAITITSKTHKSKGITCIPSTTGAMFIHSAANTERTTGIFCAVIQMNLLLHVRSYSWT